MTKLNLINSFTVFKICQNKFYCLLVPNLVMLETSKHRILILTYNLKVPISMKIMSITCMFHIVVDYFLGYVETLAYVKPQSCSVDSHFYTRD